MGKKKNKNKLVKYTCSKCGWSTQKLYNPNYSEIELLCKNCLVKGSLKTKKNKNK